MSEIDEQLKQKLLSYLDGIESKANDVGGFLQSEIPIYCQEYLSWHFWSSFIGFMSFVILWPAIAIPCAWFLRKYIKENEPDKAFPFAVVLFFSLVFTIPVTINLIELIKVVTAPRVVVVEHLRGLTK